VSSDAAVIDRIVEQNLGVYRASPTRLQEDVSQEAQVASDYRGRLVYELLQNADDAMADLSTTSDRVSFLVTDQGLWIANTGRALTENDVLGLCGLGASSKVDAAGMRRASIGHKGLGFKSVLEITDEPAVYSHTHSFALGALHARPLVDALWRSAARTTPRAVPAMRFPVAIPDQAEQWKRFAADGFNTAFWFPFRDSLALERRQVVADLLLGLPLTTVLFLKHLETVEVRVDQGERHLERAWRVSRQRSNDANRQEWLDTSGFLGSGAFRVTVTSAEQSASFLVAHDADVAIGGHRVGLSGPAWDGVELTEVSVAALEPGSDPLPIEWRHFHVFLPTSEPCPYPILVNGAFSTDLSRQRVQVSSESGDYNAHLIRQAARLVCTQLVPLLRTAGVEAVLTALDRGGSPTHEESAADLLHAAIRDELETIPLLPSEVGDERTLAQSVLPPAVLEDDGEAFREVLAPDAEWAGRRFPAAHLCVGRWSRIAADHGATELSPPESLTVLARCHTPARAKSVDHEIGKFELDPLLELCVTLWKQTGGGDREEIEDRARTEPLFPVHRNDDRTIVRVAVGDAPAFYPPQSARQELPLQDLQFMCHSMCWGALNKIDRLTLLDDRMKAWTSLFDVREFRFETVVQASVLPALVLKPDEAARERLKALRDTRALAAICQLAGRFAKPDRPLRYQRLQSDRALVNLSRMPVPCRTTDGEERWLPAYLVYFGADWIGDDSVEHIAEAVGDVEPTEFAYLASQEHFLGLLDEPAASASSESDEEGDEVELDEDADEAIETDERDRWIAFLSWIGVNRALRPVHFHDVEDDATGWLTTKDLAQPKGWAFLSLGDTWKSFETRLRDDLKSRADAKLVVPYLYEAHDLDQIVPIVRAAAADRTGAIARTLFEHLVRHWSWYAPFADCQLALVDKEKWPGARTKPQRALPEELVSGGDNLWLHRLRQRAVCPTLLGPRSPHVTWRPTAELDRRFGRRGRSSSQLMPVLELSDGLASQSIRSLADRLGVRPEPSASTFGLEDARLLCRQLERQYGIANRTIDATDLREVIKPVYRQMFELLSGSAAGSKDALREEPLLADTPDGPQFLRANEILYAETPGIRERSGVAGTVPTFILEAEPAATAPLTSIFGVRTLEDALEWQPDPGECSLDSNGLSEMRAGLTALMIPLLARIRAERARSSDVRVLREFIGRVEPVERLGLTCTLDGVLVQGLAGRPYFVRAADTVEPLQAFVVWNGSAGWPPPPEAAQGLAMALADALGINLVETFLAFIQSSPEQRLRLLDIAGAAGLLAEIQNEIADLPVGTPEDTHPPELEPTASPAGDDEDEIAPLQPGKLLPPAPLVPLLHFEQLTIDGVPMLVAGDATGAGGGGGADGRGNGGAGAKGAPRAAAGTDLGALDSLGMRITIAYEAHRLRRTGRHVTDGIPDASTDSLVVDVHSPEAIRVAEEASPVAKRVLLDLEAKGVSRLYPGFDILTIADGKADRLIELKSSGVDAHVQAMSWNEWKTARASDMRQWFWLYLVGNLRSDLGHAIPFVRAIRDPFGSLVADEFEQHQLRRAVQLHVREFSEAEHLDLGVMVRD
jgi:Domain of unknown function (DUF3883)